MTFPFPDAPEPLLQFFSTAHLSSPLAATSSRFRDVAYWIVETIPRNAERTVALRKLLEAKDCAVRAVLMLEPEAREIYVESLSRKEPQAM